MGKEIQIRSVAFFFTRGSSLVSHLISQSCAPVMKMFKKKQLKNIPSHAGLVFETSLGPKVFEAHLKTDWTGPFSWEKILDKKRKNPEYRIWIVEPDIKGFEAENIWERCHDQLGLWDYHAGQLGMIYAWRRFKIPVPQDSSRIVCSEGVGRISFPHIDLRKFAGVRGFDRLTPANEMDGLARAGFTINEISV